MAEKIIHTILNKGTNFVDRRRKNIRLGDILRLRQRGSSYREIGLIVNAAGSQSAKDFGIGKKVNQSKRNHRRVGAKRVKKLKKF